MDSRQDDSTDTISIPSFHEKDSSYSEDSSQKNNILENQPVCNVNQERKRKFDTLFRTVLRSSNKA